MTPIPHLAEQHYETYRHRLHALPSSAKVHFAGAVKKPGKEMRDEK